SNVGEDCAAPSNAALIGPASEVLTVSTMSPPAWMNRTARSPTGTEATAFAAPRSSEMTRPVYPRRCRSRPVTTGAENAAAVLPSNFGYVADEIITAADPAWIPLTNGLRNGSSAVVELSTAWVDVSVFVRTRPRPGKCLSVVNNPAACAADTTVWMSWATWSGADP